MGITERREREKEEMRERILQAAMKLFLDEGFENVSIRKLASAIEYSPATIYLYFTDKDEIFYALYTMAFGRFYELLQPLARIKDPLKRLKKGNEIYLSFAMENPELYDLMFIMRAPMRSSPEEAQGHVSLESYAFLRSMVEDCVDSGAFSSDTDIDAATFALWSFSHGMAALAIRKRAPMDGESLTKMLRRATDLVLKKFRS